MTRQQCLHMRLQQKDEQLDAMKNVFYKMKHGSHAEAAELLARLRTGESVEQLNDIWKGYSSTASMRQTSKECRNERKSAQVNDAMRSAYHVSTGPDLAQRTLFLHASMRVPADMVTKPK